MKVYADGYDNRDEPFEARGNFRPGTPRLGAAVYHVDPPEGDDVEDVEVQFEGGEWQSIEDVETIDEKIAERVREDLVEAGRDR